MDYETALKIAQAYPGSFVRRSKNGRFMVRDKSGLRINYAATTKTVDTRNDLPNGCAAHKERIVREPQSTPAEFCFWDLMYLDNREGAFKTWREVQDRADKVSKAIRSGGRESVDYYFREMAITSSMAMSAHLDHLQFGLEIAPPSYKATGFKSLVNTLTSLDESHMYLTVSRLNNERKHQLEAAKSVLADKLVGFFSFESERLGDFQSVLIFPDHCWNLEKYITDLFDEEASFESIGPDLELEGRLQQRRLLLSDLNHLKMRIEEHGKFLLDPRHRAAIDYLEFLENSGVHLNKGRRVILLRLFGWTLEEIGAQFSVTRERIRQIESKELKGHALRPFFKHLTLRRKQLTANRAQSDIRGAINRVTEKHGPLSEGEIEEKLGLGNLRFGELFTKDERARFLPKERITNSYKQWADEEILDGIQKAATMAFPLTHMDYTELLRLGYVEGPSIPTIINRFRSWGIACDKAGVESGKRSRTLGSGAKWTGDDMLAAIREYFSAGRTNTYADYEDWAKSNEAPSGGTLRKKFGSWRSIMQVGLRITGAGKAEESIND